MQNTRSKLGIKNNGNILQTDITKVSNLDSLDWESKDASTRYLTHSYHPYSAKYIPQIPRYLISNLTKKNDLILDNFVGSGTTLVESKVLGRHAIGVDINPLACLIAKVKITNIQKPFNKNVIYELLTIKLKIDSLEENHIRDFLLVAFSSILRSSPNATSGV